MILVIIQAPVVVSLNRGRPQSTVIITVGTPQKVPLILGSPHIPQNSMIVLLAGSYAAGKGR